MINEEGKIYYGLGLDNSQLQSDANKARSIIKGIGNSVEAEGARIDNAYKKIATGVAAVFSVQQAIQFARSVVEIRGEIQSLEIAFETMLGSKEKANKMMADVKELALKSPFTLTEVANNTKQLIAMGIATDKAIDTLKILGDVSAGLSVPMWRLAINYGQVSALGKLQSREIRDFAMAGVPIVEELSRMLNKTSAEIYGMVEAGEVGFPLVEKAFQNMATGGGKFDNMMEKLNLTVSGQLSKLKDQIQLAFNDIGQENEGLIYSTIDSAATIVEHYKEIGKTIAELAVGYGVYKAALISIDTIQKSITAVRHTAEAEELAKLLTVEQQAKISKMGLSKTSAEYAEAVRMEVAANVQAAQSTLQKARTEVAAANQMVAAKRAEYIAAKELEKQRLAELISIKTKGSAKQIEIAQSKLAAAQSRREAAALQFQSATRDFHAKKIAVESAAKTANTVQTSANTAAQAANVAATNWLSAAKSKLTTVATKLNAVIMKNPYAFAAAAVVGLGYAIYKLAIYQTEAEKAQKRLNEAVDEFDKSSTSEITVLNIMFSRLRKAKEGTDEYRIAKEAIQNKYGAHLSKMNEEVRLLEDTTTAQKNLTDAILETARARAHEKFIEQESSIVGDKQVTALRQIREKLIKEKGTDIGEAIYEQIKSMLVAYQNDPQDQSGEKYSQYVKLLRDNGLEDIGYGKLFTSAYASYVASVQELLKAQQDAEAYFGPPKRKDEESMDFDATTASLQHLMDELPKATDKLAELKKAETPDPEAIAKQEKELALINDQIAVRENGLRTIRDIEAQIKRLQDEQKEYGKDDDGYITRANRIKALKLKLPEPGKTETDAARIKRETAERIQRIKDYETEAKEQAAQSELNIAQSRIDAMDEGFEKEQAQNELIYRRMLFANQQREAEMLRALQERRALEWENAYPNAKAKGEIFDRSTVTAADLSPEQKAQLAAYEEVANQTRLSANKRLLESLLENYQGYEQQRLAIHKQTEDDIAALEKSRTSENSARIDAAIAQARKQQKNALSQVNLSELKEDINWESVFGNLEKVSYDTLSKLRDRLKEYMQTAQDSLSPTDLKTLADAYDELNERISALKPGEALKVAFQEYKEAIRELKEAQEDGQAASDTDKEADAQQRVTDALNRRRAAQIALNEAIQGFAGKINEALEATNAIIGALESFGITIPENVQGALEGVGQIVDGLGSVDLTKPFSVITGAFKIIGGIGKTITSLFSGDNRKERQIQRLQTQVNALAKAYDRLNDAIEKSYSAESADFIRQQGENLRRQKAFIEEQIRSEEDKKKPDHGKIDQWRQQIEDINKQIDDTRNRVIEAIIGADIKSAIDDFANAYVDAWAAGEDKAASVKDVVRKMVKSAVTELIKSRLSPEVSQFMEFLANAMQDGILSDAEQSALDEWERRLYDKADSISDSFDKYLQDDDSRKGVSRGIATASQESVDENNGRLTAIQGHTYSLNENVKLLVANSGKILEHLAGIRENTRNLHRLEEMRADISVMRKSINDLTIKGITIKK